MTLIEILLTPLLMALDFDSLQELLSTKIGVALPLLLLFFSNTSSVTAPQGSNEEN